MARIEEWFQCSNFALISRNKWITYKELYEMIKCRERNFTAKNKVYVLYGENTENFIVDLLAIIISGNIPMIIPKFFSVEKIEEVMKKNNIIDYAFSTDLDVSIDLNSRSCNCVERIIDYDNLAFFMLTSGTTSEGKIIQVSFMNLYYRILYTNRIVTREKNSIELLFVPSFSALGLHEIFLCLDKKCTIALDNKLFNPRKVINEIEDLQISHFAIVPNMLKMLVEYCVKNNINMNSIKVIYICGDKLQKDCLSKALCCFKNAVIFQGYGLTEILPVAIGKYTNSCDIIDNYVGEVIEGIKVKISNPDKNGIGEICVSGKNMANNFFDCHGNNKWIFTGDIGYLKEDSLLFLIGRKQNIVNINGTKMYMEEIESIAEAYDGVVSARGIKLDDELRGEIILLEIEKNSDTEIELDKFLLYLKKNLFNKNVPLKIRIVEKIERNSNGKKTRYISG